MKEPNLIEKAFLLKKTSIFSEINLDNLLLIADKVDTIPTSKGQILFKEGQIPQFFYIILEGEIEVSYPQTNYFQILGPGDLLGDVSLFRSTPYCCRATAQTKATLIALTKKQVNSIFAECPSVASQLLERFAQKINICNMNNEKKESL